MSTARLRYLACVLIGAGLLGPMLLGGCARMDSALGQQWVVVQLAAKTPESAAKHVTAACSHIPGLRPDPVKPTSPGGIVGSVRFNATHASDADMARLQQCLQRFPAVQGLTMNEPGD